MFAFAALALSAGLAAADAPPPASPAVRGVHLTGWAAGAPKVRAKLIRDLKEAGLNAVVIALKEYDGRIFVPGVALSREIGSYTPAIPDLPGCVRQFKEAGIYTIARIVLFKDDRLARARPDWAVHRPDGSIWTNDNGVAWVDPYRREVWDYNLAIASRAAAAGFDEIQLDYIRFPSDGQISQCRYSHPDHSPKTASSNLVDFLTQAKARLKAFGVRLSICVFGMTTSANNDMGIGQRISVLAREVDAVSPMMYPSHYNKGEMGIENPNREPYQTISRGLRDAVERLGTDAGRLRPYLQDFSLGVRYDAEKVRAQILAAQGLGVTNWVLWNPQNRYTWSALKRDGLSIVDAPAEDFPSSFRLESVEGRLASGLRQIPAGGHLRPGLTVYLEAAGKAVIRVKDGGKILLKGPASFTPRESKGWGVDIKSGAFLFSLPLLKARFWVRTPAAALAVRGTEFYVDARSEVETYLCLCSGALSVTRPSGRRGKPLELTAGHHTAVFLRSGKAGMESSPAPMEGHTDDELESLRKP